jgi:DNA-binding NtrC family response regulator
MNSHLVLLLTCDPKVEDSVVQAVLPGGSIVLPARNLGEALQIVCARGGELELAIIDFDDGCQGMTLLRAIATCQEELPIVVVTSRDVYHALAYANGAAACLAKPITAEEIAIVVEALKAPKRELIIASRTPTLEGAEASVCGIIS